MNARALVPIAVILLLTLPPSFATTSTGAVEKCGANPAAGTGGWAYYSILYGTYVSLPSGTCLYADEVQPSYSSPLVNFTNAALGSSSGPAQSFGVATEGGNATLTTIAAGYVSVNETSSSGSVKLFFYSAQVVSSVSYVTGSQRALFQADVFQATPGDVCSPLPCVYADASNDTYVMFAAALSASTITFYYAATDNSESSTVSSSDAQTSASTSTASLPGQGGIFVNTRTFDVALAGTLVILASAIVLVARKKDTKKRFASG